MIWFYTKLKHFTTEQQIFLIYTLNESVFQTLSDEEKNNMIYLFSKINSETTSFVLSQIVEAVNDRINQDEPFVVYKVNEGSDFTVIVKKENETDVYTPNILVARNSATGTILAQQPAGSSETQLLQFTDLNISENTIAKIDIRLEDDDGTGSTNGQGITELTSLFFVVSNNIDSE